MELRAQTALISAVLALAISMGVVLRARKRRLHWLFVAFGTNVAFWYLAQFLDERIHGPSTVWVRAVEVCAVLLPQPGIRFFQAFVSEPTGRQSRLTLFAGVLGGLLAIVVLTPYHAHPLARAAVSVYVVGLFSAAVAQVWIRGQQAASRLERARARYLFVVGVVATVVFATDLLPFAGLDVGPVGSALVLVVLFMLSQVIERSRLIDLYELAGRLLVLTALAFLLAGIYYVLVDWASRQGPYVLNAIVASLVILILFDPARAYIEAQIARVFFRERFDLERSVGQLRRRLAHVLELNEMATVLVEGLESSRRVTHASLFLTDPDRRELVLYTHLGPAPVERLEIATARPLVDQLKVTGAVNADELEREATERREAGEVREAVMLTEAAGVCERLQAALVLPMQDEHDELVGMLCLRDDRMRDAYSPEEIQILRELTAQITVVVENTKLHARIKERDRLAALGEMAAGLAHEIRNPLGSIKAAAQLIDGNKSVESQDGEYLSIIVEEVGRLNRVVGSFLDYARPYRGNAAVIDVNNAVEKTVAIARNDLPSDVQLEVDLGTDLPPVRIDPEHVRQVLVNLVRNSAEAMEGRGKISISTRRGIGLPPTVEVSVRDTGPGIAGKDLPNLFIPFFTTKTKGTGLGLAISQRLISSAGGRIGVRTQGGAGTTFVVSLPAAEKLLGAGASLPPSPQPEGRPESAEAPTETLPTVLRTADARGK